MNKKRQRKEKKLNKNNNEDNSSNDSMDEEENMNDKNKEKDLFNCVFIFSCIIPEYFLMIKNLLLPNFLTENISLNGLTDLVICMREDIGTTLKVENDEENKIFGVFTLIPFPFYKDNPVVMQIMNMLMNKIENLNCNKNNKSGIMNIIKNKKIGMLINERFVNLPEELIAPALNFVINEMDECIEIANDKNNKNISNKEKNKYNLDYIIVYSRYVKKENKDKKDKENEDKQMQIDDDNYINVVIKENKNKKPKMENSEEIVFYKYEIENFMKKADYSFDYKLTGGIYDSSCIYINQNHNEIQYMKIIFIKFQKFYEVIRDLNKK